jgi:hypothetical protein
MSVTGWYFLRRGPGEIQPLSLKAFEAFTSRKAPLPRGADGCVRYVQVLVELENRRAVGLVSVDFFKARAMEDGYADASHFFDVMVAAGGVMEGNLAPRERIPGVVSAEHRFAQRRLDNLSRWEPEEPDLRALRELVNRRGRAVLL